MIPFSNLFMLNEVRWAGAAGVEHNLRVVRACRYPCFSYEISYEPGASTAMAARPATRWLTMRTHLDRLRRYGFALLTLALVWAVMEIPEINRDRSGNSILLYFFA